MTKKRTTRPKKMQSINRFVLDCSVVFAWYFADEASPYADGVAASLPNSEAIVPALFPFEVAHVLVTAERRGRSSETQAASFLTRLELLPIHVDETQVNQIWLTLLDLARRHHLSAYDASYLELALRLGIPLSCLDGPLVAAAAAIGLAYYVPVDPPDDGT